MPANGKRQKKRFRSRFQKTRLSNGLTLITENQSQFRGVSIGFWVKTGTRFERPNQAGISHFLEHMLFKGTPARSPKKIVRDIENVGGDFNAFTDREVTCFHVLLNSENLKLGMEILSDILLNSRFISSEIEKERRVILEEIRMVEDTPEELAFDAFFEKTYGDHGLGLRILGTQKTIEKMKRRDLLRYFHQYYRPENTVIAISGDVSHAQALRALTPLKKKSWPQRSSPRKQSSQKTRYVEAPEMQKGLWWIRRPIEQTHLIVGSDSRELSLRDRYAGLLLSHHLGGGMSSVLFQEIREKSGLAYSAYTYWVPFEDTGMLTFYAATSPGKLERCLRLIKKIQLDLVKNGISKTALQEVKRSIRGSFRLASDDIESQMVTIARNEIFLGKYLSTDELCDEIEGVTLEEIQNVSEKLLGSPKKSILVVGPQPAPSMLKRLKALS